MADRHDYYFGELVTEDELDEGFAWLEQADHDQNRDAGLNGITIPHSWPLVAGAANSWWVRQNGVPDFSVLVLTGTAYDKIGRRLAVDPAATVLLDCSVDYLGASNAVAAGNERWITIFLKFAQVLADPRIDDNGLTVYFDVLESYELEVRQGPEEASPATTRPVRDATALIVCDILITNATPPILNAAIDYQTRSEYLCNVDMSALTPGTWTITLNRIFGRNIEETVWWLYNSLLTTMRTNLLDLYGTNKMKADIDPNASCTYDLGDSTHKWKKTYSQAVLESPDLANSGPSILVPATDWDTVPGTGHTSPAQLRRMMTGSFPGSWIDLVAREQRAYLEETIDFTKDDDPDTHRFTSTLLAGGTATPNAAPYALTYPGGIVDLLAPFATSGSALILGKTFPFIGAMTLNYWQTKAEHGFDVLPGFPAAGAVFAVGLGGVGATGTFVLIYDPSSVYLAAGNANWWAYYDDGAGNTEEHDLGVAFAPGVHKVEVAFERNALTGHLCLVWYRNNVQVHLFDLTAAGGTWLANLALLAWDYRMELANPAGGSDLEVIWDYVRGQQFREDLL